MPGFCWPGCSCSKLKLKSFVFDDYIELTVVIRNNKNSKGKNAKVLHSDVVIGPTVSY